MKTPLDAFDVLLLVIVYRAVTVPLRVRGPPKMSRSNTIDCVCSVPATGPKFRVVPGAEAAVPVMSLVVMAVVAFSGAELGTLTVNVTSQLAPGDNVPPVRLYPVAFGAALPPHEFASTLETAKPAIPASRLWSNAMLVRFSVFSELAVSVVVSVL